MRLPAHWRVLWLIAVLAAPIAGVRAQSRPGPPRPDELFRTVAALDAALFDAFNRCDLEKFASFFLDDTEFYHDQNGLTIGRQSLVEQVKKNICGIARRELVPEKMEVYPMRGYGAVQTGVHRFYQPKAGPRPTGEAKFIHLWQDKDGAWRITRVISYDHVALPQ